MKRTALALFSALSLATAAHAVEYTQVQPDKSQITFAYQQMGVAMQGAFKKFAGQLRFDPAAPAAAKSTIEVELASVDTGSSEGDTEVATKTWFDTKAFPRARFESSSVKALGGNKYEVAGKLTIKGKTLDVVVPATFAAQGKTGVFEGRLTIRRGDFSIGEGAWKAFDIVANDVVIQFRLTAAAQ
ncbi:MAG: polyisoprenoid-binding protein [Comamonadaceae bacterium SCN 68-20]|jgi:polyisoprenoid-binding protein YceI|nr:YceI family protein [Comamonadaceae bacterium]MBN9366593.1 YceI family protein [Comamonadaceae bacterium]ODU60058.1 MAG: polyisoprenoid-binding protein [Comamonadaceae bacterium SCN 68-20]OJX36526.1 MAG: polyisoprenoid-binding protein [Burkholderiales bacterium 68-20]UJB63882.1 YceI family protein [Acidovorax sp. YS12]